MTRVHSTPQALTPLADARARLGVRLGTASIETIELRDALGRIAAVEHRAMRPLPGDDRALVAGWAVAAADTVGASPYAPAFLASPVPVAAGAVLPAGCDAVLSQVSGRDDGGLLVVEASLAPGENVHRRGFDLAVDAPLLAAGDPIDAIGLALAEAAGLTEIAVRRLPVAIVAAETALAAFAASAIRTTGASIATVDETPRLVLRLGDATRRDDAPGLALSGAETAIPSEDGGIPTLTVPDRLAALATVLEALILPALRTALGRPDERPCEARPLARKLASRVGFTELALFDVDAGGRWLPLAVGDLPASAWARARAVVELPPESEGLPEATPLALPRPFLRP